MKGKKMKKKEEEEKKKTTGDDMGGEINCLCIDSEFSFIINFFAEYFTPTVIQSINKLITGI